MMKIKNKILFIAPASIPVDGPEAICNFKILKLLVDLGYDIDVVSKQTKQAIYPSQLNDLKGLKSLKIISVDNKISYRTLYQHTMAFFRTGYIFKGIHWAYEALNYIESNLDIKSYDFIFSRNSPSEIVGLYLAKKYDLRLIVNWNDPYPAIKYPPPYGEGPDAKISYFQRKLLNDLQRYAFRFSFPSSRLRDYFLRYLDNISVDKTFITPHIVDPLFSINRNVNNKDRTVTKFIHSGNCSSPRNPKKLLLALKELKFLGFDFKFDFIGEQSSDFVNLVNDYDLQEVVSILPAMPYLENLKLCVNYDVAVIIEAELEEGIFLPTKVSDYLQVGLKILALSPKIGLLADYHESKVIDYFADITSVLEIQNVLKSILIENDFVDVKKNIDIMTPAMLKRTYHQVLSL